jgi:hypothetical protein
MQDYDRLKRDRLDIIYGSKRFDGMPKGSDLGKPTELKAIQLAYIDARLDAIDQTCVLMRGWLGDKVNEFDPVKAYWSFNYFNCQHKRKGENDDGPCRRTWHNYKDRFTEVIAGKLNIY